MHREDEDGFFISGEITSDSWAEKIVRYAISKDPDIDPVFLQNYGMDEDQALRIYSKVTNELPSVMKRSLSSGDAKGDVA